MKKRFLVSFYEKCAMLLKWGTIKFKLYYERSTEIATNELFFYPVLQHETLHISRSLGPMDRKVSY